MRALWNGTLSFGLVHIPVKLFPATEERGGLDFALLHRTDLSPIRLKRTCAEEGVDVPPREIVRGYEYRKGAYVVLTDEDFRRLEMARSRAIVIADVAPADGIDPVYYEKPYYLEPARGADGPYVLLREALAATRSIGIATFVLRGREHLAAIRPRGGLLLLEQLRFPSQIRSPEHVRIPHRDVPRDQLGAAKDLIAALAPSFSLRKYRDTYTEELIAMIERKADGGDLPARSVEEPEMTHMKDLLLALRRSLEQIERRSPKTVARRRGESVEPTVPREKKPREEKRGVREGRE